MKPAFSNVVGGHTTRQPGYRAIMLRDVAGKFTVLDHTRNRRGEPVAFDLSEDAALARLEIIANREGRTVKFQDNETMPAFIDLSPPRA